MSSFKLHIFLVLSFIFSLLFTGIQSNSNETDESEEDTTEESKPEFNDLITFSFRALFKFISFIFLFITVMIYVKNSRSSLSDKCLIAHCTGLFFYITFNSLDNILHIVHKEFVTKICFLVNVLWIYSFLTSFFWLQVMSYDIWHSFKQNSGTPMTQKKKFIIYCVYALGIPFFITAGILYFEINGRRSYHHSENCIKEMETMLCLILPTLIILITNIFFFVSTARRIHAARRNLQTSDGSEHLRFKLYLKLFGIMGGSWILLFFVVIVGSFISQLHSVIEVIFTIVLKVSVLIVDLQGFWIFMVCVWMTHHRNAFIKSCLPCGCAQRCASQQHTQDHTVVEFQTVVGHEAE